MTDIELLEIDIDALKNEINRLYIKAESGEQYAHICLLEQRLIQMERDYDRQLHEYVTR